jgi:hypothetical protein
MFAVLQVYVILQIVSLLIGLVAVVRVWRASTFDGILSLFVPFYILFAMVRYWNQPDHDIRWHVFAMLVLGGTSVWMSYRAVDQIHASEVAGRSAATGQRGQDQSAGGSERLATGEVSARSAASAATQDESETTPRVASAEDLRWLASRVTFYRGRFERPTTGYTLTIPSAFHLLDNADARRMEAAFGHPLDKKLVAWGVEQNLALTDPALWVVRMRWMNEGLVVASAGELDATGLLNAARTQTHVPRLASSGGSLQRFVAAPAHDGNVIYWVEERLPEGAKTSVFDCHALRLARKGVLEFSIVGARDALQKSCLATLRAFAQTVTFEPALDYPTVTAGVVLAPYSLSGLIAQTQ